MPVYRTTFVSNGIAALREAEPSYHLNGKYFYYKESNAVQYAFINAANEKEAHVISSSIIAEVANNKPKS